MLSLILITVSLFAFGGTVGYASAVIRRKKEITNYLYHREQMDKLENFEKNNGYKVVDLGNIGFPTKEGSL